MTDAPGSGAASVASQLLAFFREPARFRPYYLHGDEPLPEGHVVLKFALGRFAPGWRRDLPAHDQEELSEAARAFVRQVCLWERATHYQVLCLEQSASRDAIKENYRLMIALLHPDRQDTWPADGAQRVNDAYAVLADDGLRGTYDEGLRKSHVAAPFEHVAAAPRTSRRARRAGIVRPFLVVTAVLAALFAVQSWWVSDVPQHYTLLDRARVSTQWVRDALPTELPRFIDSRPAVAFDPLELLAPSKLHYRLASVSAWTPRPAISTAESSTVRSPHEPAAAASAPPSLPAAMPREPSPLRLAQAPALRLAQGPVPSAAPSAASGRSAAVPSAEEIELLVARLVSYYEAGDAEGLVGLFDPDALGLWKGYRTRGTYADFFRATKERRLRMNRLNWQTASQSAQARGDATVLAAYSDGSGKLERRVAIEIDIGMRGGQARITRLILFPDAR